MDVHEWLQHVDNRDLPGADAGDDTLHRHGHVVQQQSETNDSWPAGAKRKPPLQPEKPVETDNQQDCDSSATSSESQRSSSLKSYRRRSRHKTRDDRYELKRKKKHTDEARKPPARKIKRTRATKDETQLAREFELNSRTREQRLTLVPSRAGLFSRGRAVGVTKLPTGMPDLSFNELEFLQNPIRIIARVADGEQQVQGKDRVEHDAKISAYFAATNNPAAVRPASSPRTTSTRVPDVRQRSSVTGAVASRGARPARKTQDQPTRSSPLAASFSPTSMLLPQPLTYRQAALPAVSEPEEWQSLLTSDNQTTAELPRRGLKGLCRMSSLASQRAGCRADSQPPSVQEYGCANSPEDDSLQMFTHQRPSALQESQASSLQLVNAVVESSKLLSEPMQQSTVRPKSSAHHPHFLNTQAQSEQYTETRTQATMLTGLASLPVRGFDGIRDTAEQQSRPAVHAQATFWHGIPSWQEEALRAHLDQQDLGTYGDLAWLQSPPNMESNTPLLNYAEPLSSIDDPVETNSTSIAAQHDHLGTFWRPNRLY